MFHFKTLNDAIKWYKKNCPFQWAYTTIFTTTGEYTLYQDTGGVTFLPKGIPPDNQLSE